MQLLIVLLAFAAFRGCATASYTNSWAVEVTGGLERADSLAEKYGFINEGQVGNLKNIYHFKLPKSQYFSRNLGSVEEPIYDLTRSLKRENDVGLVEQQKRKKNFKRTYSPPSDPLWDDQWSLLNTGQLSAGDAGNDINVVPAWIQGLTGCNTFVGIVDDGVEYTHTDLEINYNKGLGYDYINGDSDPFPDIDQETGKRESHGTECAGEIGMSKSNNKCGVGVAYQSTITGIKLIGNNFGTDMKDAMAISHLGQVIDVYSNSWGPSDDGNVVSGPGTLTRMAFETGAREGRDGRGSIWVWAAGNGGLNYDSCAADGFTSSIYTIAIGSAYSNGSAAFYDERCSAKMAATLVSDQDVFVKGLDMERAVATSTVMDECVTNFDGTSAACPLASGIMALVLEANRGLTWRDVQYLVAYTSNPDILTTDDWATNAAGLQFSHQFGFGALDAEAMVTRARRWINVPQQRSETVFPAQSSGLAAVGGYFVTTFSYSSGTIVYLEHVVVTMSIYVDRYAFRGDTQVLLTSPSGTNSLILPLRFRDDGLDYIDWPFMSVHFWGEDPEGTWQLTVQHIYSGSVTVEDMSMTLYGTASVPEAVSQIPDVCDAACARGCADSGPEFCDSCVNLRNAETLECITQCPNGFAERNRYCYDASLPEPVCDRIVPTSPPTDAASFTTMSWMATLLSLVTTIVMLF